MSGSRGLYMWDTWSGWAFRSLRTRTWEGWSELTSSCGPSRREDRHWMRQKPWRALQWVFRSSASFPHEHQNWFLIIHFRPQKLPSWRHRRNRRGCRPSQFWGTARCWWGTRGARSRRPECSARWSSCSVVAAGLRSSWVFVQQASLPSDNRGPRWTHGVFLTRLSIGSSIRRSTLKQSS